jgi:hypothetical protein
MASDVAFDQSSYSTMVCNRMNEPSMMRSICLTVDHEIFGNESGDPQRDLVEEGLLCKGQAGDFLGTTGRGDETAVSVTVEVVREEGQICTV